MNKLKYFCILIISIITPLSYAGISYQLGAQRVIYNEGDKAQTLQLINNSSETKILTQTILLDSPIKGTRIDLFKVLPERILLEPNSSSQIKIILIKDNLPKNRESVFYINSKAFTSASPLTSDDDKIQGAVNLGVANIIKLFYRPNNLSMSLEDSHKNIQFKTVGNLLEVNNPSPYYLNLSRLEVNGEKIDLGNKKMISPYQKVSYSSSKTLIPSNYRWTLINDTGGLDEYKKSN